MLIASFGDTPALAAMSATVQDDLPVEIVRPRGSAVQVPARQASAHRADTSAPPAQDLNNRAALHEAVLRRKAMDGTSYESAYRAVQRERAIPTGTSPRHALHARAVAYQREHRCDYPTAVRACE